MRAVKAPAPDVEAGRRIARAIITTGVEIWRTGSLPDDLVGCADEFDEMVSVEAQVAAMEGTMIELGRAAVMALAGMDALGGCGLATAWRAVLAALDEPVASE